MMEQAREMVSRYAARGILIDSNLLLVLLVGTIDRDLVGTYKRTQTYTPSDYDLLSDLLSSARRFVITPHVGTEISNLAGRLRERSPFGDLWVSFLRQADESYHRTSELATSTSIRRLGLADVAIARWSLRRRRLVVTDDLPLAVFIEKSGGAVINFNHLRNYA